MSRRRKIIDDDAGKTVVTKKDEQAIEEAFYLAKQLAITGKLRKQTGTLKQRYSLWISCFDVVIQPRSEGLPDNVLGLGLDMADSSPPPIPAEDAIRPGDLNAASHLLVMTFLRGNALFVVSKDEAARIRRDDLILYYKLSDEKTALLLAKARAGDPIAYELLLDMLEQFEKQDKIAMPQVLREFRSLLRRGEFRDYKPASGDKQPWTQRDAELINLIHYFLAKGYKPTRSKDAEYKKPGAIWIVYRGIVKLAELMPDLKLDSYRTLERRWSEAITEGHILRPSRYEYELAQLDGLLETMDGKELINAFGGTMYPVGESSATLEAVEHARRLFEWTRSLVMTNDNEISADAREASEELTKFGMSMIEIGWKLVDLETRREAISGRLSALSDPIEIAALQCEIDRIDAESRGACEQFQKEFPELAGARELCIPREIDQLGIRGPLEAARLLQLNATTEVHHDATREGPR